MLHIYIYIYDISRLRVNVIIKWMRMRVAGSVGRMGQNVNVYWVLLGEHENEEDGWQS